jgi:hypothetical protein
MLSIISWLPELLSFLLRIIHPLSAAGIRIGIDEVSKRIYPSYATDDGLQIPITDDFRMNCLLASLDLPLSSSDLIDVSTVQDISQLSTLPPSWYSSIDNWKRIESKMAKTILLNLLDEERYKIAEPVILSLVEQVKEPIKWLFNLQSLAGDRIVNLESLSELVFPKRHVLKTFKSKIIDGSLAVSSYYFAFITHRNLIDWARVFFEEHSVDKSDKQISGDRGLLQNVIDDIGDKFREPHWNKLYFAPLMECYTLGTMESKTLPFYERLRICVEKLGINDGRQIGRLDGEFHAVTIARRNKLFIESGAFDDPNDLKPIDDLLNVYFNHEETKFIIADCLFDHLKQRGLERLHPLQWKYLGQRIQETRTMVYNDSSMLPLIGYFLGHVEITAEFRQAYPRLQGLPTTEDKNQRVNSDETAAVARGWRNVYDRITYAFAIDPELVFTSKAMASNCISSRFAFSISCLLYYTEGNEPFPKYGWLFGLDPLAVPTKPQLVPLIERILSNVHKLPINDMSGINIRSTSMLLKHLKYDVAARLLRHILLRTWFYHGDVDIYGHIDRLFTMIFASKDDLIEVLKQCIGSTSRFNLPPKLYRFIPEMTIKHFDLSSPDNLGLLSLVLEAAIKDTKIFVKLFQDGKVFVTETDVMQSAISRARPELQSWFFKRYEIIKISDQEYKTMPKSK